MGSESRRAIEAGLPPEVAERAKRIQATPHLAEISKRLIDEASGDPDRLAMWKSLERASKAQELFHGDEWVLAFLDNVLWAQETVPYLELTMSARGDKAKHLRSLAADLVSELRACGLDTRVVRPPRPSNWGWVYYEDMSESNQRRCDASGEPLFAASSIIEGAIERAATLLETELYLGQSTGQAMAVRFCLRLSEANEIAFGQPLNRVVATAANVLFGTNYSPNDVTRHRSRKKGVAKPGS